MTRNLFLRPLCLGLIIAFAALSAPRPSFADDASLRKAKKQYARGSKLYEAQSYKRALEAFEAAYDHEPIAGLLYNIAQCYRKLGNFELAIEKYSDFLELATDAPAERRRLARQRITDMTKAITKAKRDEERLRKKQRDREITGQSGSSGGKRDNDIAQPIYKKWWFWAGAAVVAVGATAGTVWLLQPDVPSSDGGNFKASNL